jgi:dTDP-4-amino-4,6-dideoxygalactose transaminase
MPSPDPTEFFVMEADKVRIAPWPYFAEDEMEAVRAVLESGQVNYWTGKQCTLFEEEFASYCDVSHAVTLANASVGLDLAMRALGIGAGDEVIVTPRSFFASAGAIVLSGATPIFADVDRDSQNITVESMASVMTPRTKAILCVHLAGWPCDMEALLSLAKDNGLFVIEDCAQAHGAKFNGKAVGSWGDIGVFSFCQDKIMTTGGEGGMLVTNDTDLWSKVWSYKDHGKSLAAVNSDSHPAGFRWLHTSFGSNYRMTEMQAAIGRCQLRKLDGWIETRQRNAGILRAALSSFKSVRIPVVPESVNHACYKLDVFIVPEELSMGWDRERVLERLSKYGISPRTGSCPEIYLEEAFQSAGLAPKSRLIVAKELGETSLQFVVHPTIGDGDMRKYSEAVAAVLAEATPG